MQNYCKVFGTIMQSSLIEQGDDVVMVFLFMLATKDHNHEVHSTPYAISKATLRSRERVDTALDVLMSPDPDSRSKVLDGRRLTAIRDGWFVVNGEHYRKLMNAEDQRERTRQRVADYRKRNVNPETGELLDLSIDVTHCNGGNTIQIQSINRASQVSDITDHLVSIGCLPTEARNLASRSVRMRNVKHKLEHAVASYRKLITVERSLPSEIDRQVDGYLGVFGMDALFAEYLADEKPQAVGMDGFRTWVYDRKIVSRKG